MRKISESIFSGKTCIVPMADVQHIERHWIHGSEPETPTNYAGILVITKHTRWDMEADGWANNIYLPREEGDRFINAWCQYRYQLENLEEEGGDV